MMAIGQLTTSLIYPALVSRAVVGFYCGLQILWLPGYYKYAVMHILWISIIKIVDRVQGMFVSW